MSMDRVDDVEITEKFISVYRANIRVAIRRKQESGSPILEPIPMAPEYVQALLDAAERERLYKQALKIISGKEQCLDVLMGDKDVAREALAKGGGLQWRAGRE